MPFSPADQLELDSLEPKLQLIRDRVIGLINHLSTGLYLWGEGGTSKSYTVLDTLQKNKANYVLHSARLTGRGLFDALRLMPTSIHLIEDCESLMADKLAWGVLRSALWSQSKKRPMEREVPWQTFNNNLRFLFTGSIVIIANLDLANQPELRAIKTRIVPLHLIATFNEIAALMRSEAKKGYPYGEDYVTPNECDEIVEFIIVEHRSLYRNLDMRLMVNSFRDYIQWKGGLSKTDWKELIKTRMWETVARHESRQVMKNKETIIAVEIDKSGFSREDKIKLWLEKTGKSERAFYRRLKDAEQGV